MSQVFTSIAALLTCINAVLIAAPLPDDANHRFNVEKVKESLQPLTFDSSITCTRDIQDYFSFYGLDFDGIQHYFGIFRSSEFTCAAHVFIPDTVRSTVYLIHGYYDHVGILKNVIRLCLDNNIAVAAFDLPGHGLSTGERASIDDFSKYSKALGDFIEVCRPHLSGPCLCVGHSIGCAVILDYLYTSGGRDIAKTILLAPGIRSVLHGFSKFGLVVYSPFSRTSPRWFRNSSSDKHFLQWYNAEPLQYNRFPLQWATAFYAWQDRFASFDTLSANVAVIQGGQDETVDWKRNMRTLTDKIPSVKIIPIVRARHQLINEAEPVRTEVLLALKKELNVFK